MSDSVTESSANDRSDVADASAGGDRLRYRLLTGPDTSAFCERVSAMLDDGYVLYGSPQLTFDGTTTYVAQALILES